MNKGFTLIEMMIVIAIIAALSAVAIPSLISWRSNAQLNSAVRGVVSEIAGTRQRAVKDNLSIAFDLDEYFNNHPAPGIKYSSAFSGNAIKLNSRGLATNFDRTPIADPDNFFEIKGNSRCMRIKINYTGITEITSCP